MKLRTLIDAEIGARRLQIQYLMHHPDVTMERCDKAIRQTEAFHDAVDNRIAEMQAYTESETRWAYQYFTERNELEKQLADARKRIAELEQQLATARHVEAARIFARGNGGVRRHK